MARKKKSSSKNTENGPNLIEDESVSTIAIKESEVTEEGSDCESGLDLMESEGLLLEADYTDDDVSEISLEPETDLEASDLESEDDTSGGADEESEVGVEASSEIGAEISDELSQFESAEIEELEFVEYDKLMSIVESLLFSTDRPLTVDAIRTVFKGTNVKGKDIRSALEDFSIKLASMDRGVSLEEIGGGFQLRTKIDNSEFMKRHVKGRAFKLSGPALEVLSIVAYKQPCIKSDVDEIRGVESGHLMRALMDRGIIRFGGKSELPGKPMFYETTRRFLEIFGLRSVQELPSLSQIDELIPDGIGEVEPEKKSLKDLTPELSMESSSVTYSDGETELLKISEQLSGINTSSDFFEKEKARQRRKRDEERAQDIRESVMLGQDVEDKDIKWLKKFEQILEAEKTAAANVVETVPDAAAQNVAQDLAEEGETGESVVLDARTESQDPGDLQDQQSGELSDDQILEKVDFEMSEGQFKGEEVVGFKSVEFIDPVENETESKKPPETET